MTGRYPHRNGMQTPFCGGSPEGLNLNETLMSEYMNSAGSAPPPPPPPTLEATGTAHLGRPLVQVHVAHRREMAPGLHVLGAHAHLQRLLVVLREHSLLALRNQLLCATGLKKVAAVRAQGFYGCAQDYYLHGSVGSLDFHHVRNPALPATQPGEGACAPQHPQQ